MYVVEVHSGAPGLRHPEVDISVISAPRQGYRQRAGTAVVYQFDPIHGVRALVLKCLGRVKNDEAEYYSAKAEGKTGDTNKEVASGGINHSLPKRDVGARAVIVEVEENRGGHREPGAIDSLKGC